MISQMSSGVSSFDHISLDLEERGAADIDIPVLILGIGITAQERQACSEKRARYACHEAEMLANGEVDGKRSGALPGPK